MQHMSVCAFVFVRGCSVTANIFTKHNREVRHWSLHVHSGPHKVQTMSQPYIKYMRDVCVQDYGALLVI